MPEEGEAGRISRSADQAITSAMLRLLQLRAQRLALEAGVPAFDPLCLNPLIQLLEFPSGGLLERVQTRFHSLSVFWRYQRLISRHCRALTDTRLESVRRGLPLRWESVLSDDRAIRLALRQLRVALLLFLLGYRQAVDLAKASRDELNRVFGSPQDATP